MTGDGIDDFGRSGPDPDDGYSTGVHLSYPWKKQIDQLQLIRRRETDYNNQ